VLIGQNGFLAGKVGLHFNRTFGLAILIPIVPIYGAMGATFLSSLPILQGAGSAAVIPLLLVPGSFAYQQELRKLCRSGKDRLEGIRRWMHRFE
jgi:type IV secretory pathway VirB10-like protein